MHGSLTTLPDGDARARDRIAVLRLCSVFEPPPHVDPATVAGFDPVGGMQNHTAALTGQLDRLGFEQTIVTTRPPGYPRVSSSGNVTVLRVGLPVPMLRQLYGVAAALKLVRLSTHHIVHMHVGEDLSIVPLGTLASRGGVPTLLTIHCNLRDTFSGKGMRALVLRSFGAKLERVGARRASAIIVLSESARQAMVHWGINPRRVHVIPSGVVPDLFRGPFPDPLPQIARPRILFVGRIAAQKDVRTLIRAIALMKTQGHLVIVGDGPERVRVARLAESLGVRNRLTITGFVRHEHVPRFLHHADVLVLPSMFEELGSVLVEGMCSRSPIVASRVKGIASVIDHDKNGVLVPPADPVALAHALDRVLTDRELARRLGERAYASSARFTWASLARRVASIYLRVLEEVRRPTATPQHGPYAP
jgi:glycogen(starch) synthase